MTQAQRPSPSAEGHHGEMLSFFPEIPTASNVRKSGLFPPEPMPLIPCDKVLESQSDVARELFNYLMGFADEYGGEAIVRTADALSEMAVSRAILLDALEELVQSRDLESYCFYNASLMCVVRTDMSVYYGDDLNPEPDFMGDLASEGDVEGEDDPSEPEIELGVTPLPSPSNPKRARVYAKTNGWCFYCITTPAREIDHMHPRIRGGGNKDENLIGACKACNVRKKDRTVEEFRAYLAHRNRYPDIGMVRFYGERFQ